MRMLVLLSLSIPLLVLSAKKFTVSEFTLPDNLLRDGTDGSNHVCPSIPGQENVKMNDFHYRGAALGGWLVLEPWITPSLFYQFLGASQKWGDEAPDHVGLDSMSFCQALGPEEANLQLRRHWKTWVTEQEIADLRVLGADTLRLPVGDWMYVPYGPYIGCYDGALEELQRVLRLCEKYGLKVLLDIHAMKGSQNGLDNSGTTGNMEWVYTISEGGSAKYLHWDIRGGEWIGHYNQTTKMYTSLNQSNIDHSLRVVQILVDIHKDDPVIIGLEPLNEPWEYTPIDALKDFYWASYQIVQRDVPHWITVFHDSFRLSFNIWGKFMVNCPNYAMDTHIYQAWFEAGTPASFQEQACSAGANLKLFEDAGVPIIVGEWSLATDNCAMWLNGLNNNLPGYPKVVCSMVKCPDPYMGLDQPGTPPDSSENLQDPFGSGGESFVRYGLCPVDQKLDNEDEDLRILGLAKLHSYDRHTHGHFFWNFRTELEPRWSFKEAVRQNWMPFNMDDADVKREIAETCPRPLVKIIVPSKRSWTKILLNYRNLIMLLVIAFVFNTGFVAYQCLKKHGRRATYLPIVGGGTGTSREFDDNDLELRGRQPVM